MVNGFLTNPNASQALTGFGLGLLNISQNRQINPAQSFALAKAFQNPEQQPAQAFQGINPSYNLPTTTPVDNSVDRLMHSIGQLESGNNYNVIGPRTRSGDRAYGQYQVMGANIPAWTKEVLGYSMTPEQFLQDKNAQDAVARAKLGGYLNQYGNIDDAASMWFSGRPYRNNLAKDVLGTSVPQYVQTVRRNY